MKTQKEKWKIFLSTALSPGTIIFSFLTILSLFIAYIFKNNTSFSTLLSILSSFFAGFAGNFIRDDYVKLTSQDVLEKKGRSALRNLQCINTQLYNIKSWILEFLKNTRKKEDKNTLREINRHISTIELNIKSGLEDWVDIVPELKEKSLQETEMNKKYKELAQSVMVEILEKRKELASVKDKKMEKELKNKISDLENQIQKIKNDRSQVMHGVGLSNNFVTSEPVMFSLSDLNNNNFISASSLLNKKCAMCGNQFTQNYLSAKPLGTIYNDYCDDCIKKL